jgi:hypothetical protein
LLGSLLAGIIGYAILKAEQAKVLIFE